jgi:hypothetical protein
MHARPVPCERCSNSVKTTKLLALSFLGLVACSSRSCATCVGYTPTKSLGELDKLAVSIEQVTSDIDGPYGSLRAAFALVSDPKEVCPALPETTTLAWNGAAAQKPTRNGGGQNMWWGRGDAYTICGQVESTFPSTNNTLFNGPGPIDHLIINDGSSSIDVTMTSGRPKIEKPITTKDITVVFEGFDGTIAEAQPCAFKVGSKTGCMPLTVTSKTGNQVVAKFDPKPRTAGDWLLVGRVTLRPKTTCASKTCSATLSYSMRIPFTAQ